MDFLDFLLQLDTWVKAASGLIFAVFFTFLFEMYRRYRRVRKQIDGATGSLDGLQIKRSEEHRFGRSTEAYERIRQVAGKLGPAHTRWWKNVESAVELYESPEGREGYFLTRQAKDLVALEEVSKDYNSSLYHAVPGILTSLGLLGTFIAILLGLKGLHMDDQTGMVSGLPSLISNLSGKFVTSILALFLSMIFLLVELRVCRPGLRTARGRLVSAIGDLIPYLSASRILLDIQKQSVKQATSLSNISADIVDKFANVFRDDLAPVFAQGISVSMASELHSEMGPTFTQLRETMGQLGETVTRLEATKQESVVGELRGLVEALDRSLQKALGDMGRQFHGALTGSTKEEFGKLAEIINGSATVVQGMNSNFEILQSTLQSVITEARTTTTAQMNAGLEQTERLNALAEGLMTRLNESANSNYQQLSTTLATVVTDLSERITKLSTDLASTVESAAAQSQATVESTIRHADEWTTGTSARLDALLAKIERNSENFEQAGDTLLQAQQVLQETLAHSHNALSSLGAAAGEVKAYTTGLAGIQGKLVESQQAQAQVTSLTRDSISKLVEAAVRHQEFLGQYQSTFEHYQDVFENLDTRIAAVLNTILDRMQQYNRSVEANFQSIVESANEVMPKMTGVLRTQTEALGEQLEELNSTLEQGTRKLAAARSL